MTRNISGLLILLSIIFCMQNIHVAKADREMSLYCGACKGLFDEIEWTVSKGSYRMLLLYTIIKLFF